MNKYLIELKQINTCEEEISAVLNSNLSGYRIYDMSFKNPESLERVPYNKITDLIQHLKSNGEKIYIIQDDLTKEEKSLIKTKFSEVTILETPEQFNAIGNVSPKMLEQLFKFSWCSEWSAQTMWVGIGSGICEENFAQLLKQNEITLKNMLSIFPVVVSRGADADWLEIYSNRHDYSLMREMVSSVIPEATLL